VTPIFYKLRQNTALSRHSQERSGIDGHGKESTVTVGSRYCGGVVQLARTLVTQGAAGSSPVAPARIPESCARGARLTGFGA
jgi:hypothetical protein